VRRAARARQGPRGRGRPRDMVQHRARKWRAALAVACAPAAPLLPMWPLGAACDLQQPGRGRRLGVGHAQLEPSLAAATRARLGSQDTYLRAHQRTATSRKALPGRRRSHAPVGAWQQRRRCMASPRRPPGHPALTGERRPPPSAHQGPRRGRRPAGARSEPAWGTRTCTAAAARGAGRRRWAAPQSPGHRTAPCKGPARTARAAQRRSAWRSCKTPQRTPLSWAAGVTDWMGLHP